MGGCLKGTNRHNGSQFSQSEEHPSEISADKFTLIEDGMIIRKNITTGRLQAIPYSRSQREQISVTTDDKRNDNLRSSTKMSVGNKLPTEIDQFISKHKQRSQIFVKEREKKKQKQRQEAQQFFGIKSNGGKSSIISISKGSSIEDIPQDVDSVIDIITSYGHQIYESKFQRQLLTTNQFKYRLERIKLKQMQPAKQYKFIRQLGKGSMCKVYLATSLSDHSQRYAVRIIAINDPHLLQKIKQQIAVMSLCQSRNIIQYHFSYYFQNTLFMFIEYMKYGSLNNFIAKYRKNIDEPVIAYIIRQILKGLEVIHRRRQLHRDLKSDNILVNQIGDIKIGDFGYALQFTKENTTSCELAGTPAWMAPELIKRQEYTESVDIWSLGIILVQLCEGEPRYLRMKPLIAMVMIVSKPPETVTGRSEELRKFLGKCLKKDPNERATAKQLLTDPFILGIGLGTREKEKFVSMYSSVKLN